MTTAEELIQLALQGNQGLVNRARTQADSLVSERLASPSTLIQNNLAGPNSSPTGEGGHGPSPFEGLNPYGLDPELYGAIEKLNSVSPFGPNTVSVGSGYRSYEEQERLYNDWMNGVPGQAQAAPPGRSNHNHGTAADLEYMNDEAREWVHSVAADLGLHFPVPGENWHVERIG